jgi:hypothetical protein
MQRLRLRSQGDGGLPKARGVGGGPMRQLGNGWYPIEIKDSISPSVGKKRPCNQCCPADSDSVNLGSNPGPPAIDLIGVFDSRSLILTCDTLQHKTQQFQWLPIAAGSSMRHTRNMATPQSLRRAPRCADRTLSPCAARLARAKTEQMRPRLTAIEATKTPRHLSRKVKGSGQSARPSSS